MLKPPATSDLLADPVPFQRKLKEWFRKSGKSYPWRETTDPYKILVSEVMLQQTTIASVLKNQFFTRFIERYPTTAELAQASEEELLSLWEGLGYYSRARNLKKAAEIIENEHGGIFPQDWEALNALPGVGPYTAGAVASFAFGQRKGLVDGNVHRVFARLMDYRKEVDSAEGVAQMWEWAEHLVPEEEPGAYNSALMELGQTVCSRTRPDCVVCPVSEFCKTRTPLELPTKKPRVRSTSQEENVIFYQDKDGRVLLEQEQGSRRKGMWKLPTSDDESGQLLHTQNYVITRYKVKMRVFAGGFMEGENLKLFTREEIKTLPMPSPYRRALNTLVMTGDK